MRKQYFIWLTVSGVLTALSLIPGFPIAFTFLTIGMGFFALIAVINLFVFLLCIFPIAVQRLPKPLALILSAALLVVCFLGPGFISNRAAEKIMAVRLLDEVRSQQSFVGKKNLGLEIIRPETLNAGPGLRILSNKPCDLLCQRALHGGQVDWVRVVAKEYDDSIKKVLTFTRGDGAGCTNELCFIYAENTQQAADITVEFHISHGHPKKRGQKPQGWADLRNIHTISVFDGSKAAGEKVWHQTELEISKFGMVSFFGAHFDADGGLAPPLVRVSSDRNAIDLGQIANGLALDLASPMLPKAVLPQFKKRHQRLPPKPLKSGDTRKIASLLNQPGEITQQSKQEIGGWLSLALRADALAESDVSLIMQIAKDPRMERPFHLDHVFASKKEVQAVMLPWLFDAMEQESGANVKTLQTLFQELSGPKFSNAQLAPYADRYRALLDKEEPHWQIVMPIGRFGFDPAPQLSEIYTAKGASTGYLSHGEYAIRAVCASDVQWHQDLAPLVRNIVKNQISEDRRNRPSFDIRNGLTFLTRTGHRDDVIAIIKASRWKDKAKLLTSNLTVEKPGFGRRKGVCG
ncbi:MAG: hypothetical protein ACSHXB_18105 [Sulfitobacter sp.]